MLNKFVLGKEVCNHTDVNAQVDYDPKNQEVVMLIKLSVENEILLEIQDGNDAFFM